MFLFCCYTGLAFIDIIELTSDNIVTGIGGGLWPYTNRAKTDTNHTMVLTYFEIGRMIVEEEQNGSERAGYGKKLISTLSKKLTVDFGKGFSKRNL